MAKKQSKPKKYNYETLVAEEVLKKENKPKVVPEVRYEGKSHFIPELNLTVKIKSTSSLKLWIAKYGINNATVRAKLFKKHGITQEYLEENDLLSMITISSSRHHKKLAGEESRWT